MKRIKTIIMAASAVLLLMTGCSEDEISRYDTSYTALNVWFGNSGGVVIDSAVYNYSYNLGEDSLTFYARVLGLPSDRDRQFTLEVIDGDEALAAGSYRTQPYTIKAGETAADFSIYFDTSKLSDASAFSAKDGHLTFRVSENDEFEVGPEGLNQLKVVLRNYLSKPDEWDAATYPMRPYSAYFGAYSKVKYQFMIQELGLVDFHISYTATVNYDETTNTISHNYATFLTQKLQLALEEYNAAHETPLTDENGSVVVF